MKNLKKSFIYFLMLLAAAALFSGKAKTKSHTVAKSQGEILLNGRVVPKDLSSIQTGATIDTGKQAGSFIDLDFPAGHKIRLKNGKLKIDSSGKKIKLNLIKGKLLVYAKKLGRKSSFHIYTPTVITGVRGTKFLIEEKANKTYFCVCEGVISGQKLDKSEEEVLIKKGEDLYIEQDKKTGKPVEAPDMVKMTLQEFTDMGLAAE